jgi:RNA polymerase sigma-70 factor (ECF subfamily)
MDHLTRLAHRARTGDEGALDAFVDGTYEQVWRFCAGLLDEQSADDLAQETFVRAVRALSRYRGDASARTWLLAIARHVCLDELRARGRRRRGGEVPRGTSGVPPVADASQESVVADLLGRLEPDRRIAFVLTQVLGLSYDEAARACGCPTGTIRSRVARAREDLLKLLGHRRETQSPRAEDFCDTGT